MKEQEKVQFLNAPVSQTGLFGDAVESFAQQFSAAQKQTEAFKHIMRRRKPAASTLAAAPQPARRRGRPLRPPSLPRSHSSLPPGSVVEPVAGRTPSPSRPPPNLAASARGPETGDPEREETAHWEMVTAPLPPPEEGRWIIFCFCSAVGPEASGTQNFTKRAVSSVSGSQEGESCELCITGSLPSSSLASGQQWVPKSSPSAHSWNQVRAVTLESLLHVITRRAVTSLKPGSCVSSHMRRNQVSVTLHTQTPPLPSQAPGRVPVFHHSAPPWVRWFCWHGLSEPGLQSVPVAPADHQTRLCDSVRLVSPQVQGHLVHFNQGRRCPCLACGSHSLAGEICDRAGPSSRHEVRVLQPLLHCAQQKWWVTTDLGSASFDPCALQAAVQDGDAETHFRARPSPRLVCSDQPEGRVLSWLTPTATQDIPAIRVWGSLTEVLIIGPKTPTSNNLEHCLTLDGCSVITFHCWLYTLYNRVCDK